MTQVLIAGMHRSGTSAVARLVQALGLYGGEPDDLVGRSASNVHGHFEATRLVALNDTILQIGGGHWSAPIGDVDHAAQAAGRHGAEARAIVRDVLRGAPNVYLKDPRLSLVLPFWRTVMPDAALILCHRAPGAVASSLHARNNMPIGYGLELWDYYNRRMLHDARGMQVFPVSYEALLEDPADHAARLSRFFGIEGDVETAAATIDPASRHHRGDAAQHIELHNQLLALDPGQLTLETAPPTITLAAHVQAAAAARLDLVDEQMAVLAEREDEVRQLTFDRAQANLDADQATRLRIDVTRTRTEFTERLDRIKFARDRMFEEREALERELAEARNELESLRHRVGLYEGSRAGKAVQSYWRLGRVLKGQESPAVLLRSSGGGEGATELEGIDADPAEAEPAPPPPPAQALPKPASEYRPLEVWEGDGPVVTIVVPVHGELAHTVACLRSINRHTYPVGFRIVVVDDCSPDDTAEWLATCTGIKVITNEVNQGYLRSTNIGAAAAETPFICLLNNDTTVSPGWLDALVDLARSSADIGAVGAKLVYPDGRLQEAGGIIFDDATGWNYGRGFDPRHFRMNHVRDVDYCSAACLLVRTDLWRELGGFDERFVPAYYEDTDLCFSLRSAGYRVLYQPQAEVVHHEGVSHGTDLASGLKAHQLVNRDRFMLKWAQQLAQQHPPGTDPPLAAWRSDARRVLVVDHELPAPDRDSGSVRMWAILDLLLEFGYRVSFVPRNRSENEPYLSMLQQKGIEVFYGGGELRQFIERIGPELDAAIISRPNVGVNILPMVRRNAPGVPILYDMVDFHGLRLERRGAVLDEPGAEGYAAAMAEIEAGLTRLADATLAITDEEAALVSRDNPDAAVWVLPNIHRSERSLAPFSERSGLLFVGSWNHPPNADAIGYLLDELMPEIWKQRPDIPLEIVGSDLPAEIHERASERVTVHGWVEDLEATFDHARLSIAPLRFGAGLKGKVGDSLMRGLPIVTTPVGAEGFGRVRDAMFIGETTAELAASVIAVYDDEAAWTSAADLGRELIVADFGYEAARERLRAILAAVAQTHSAASL